MLWADILHYVMTAAGTAGSAMETCDPQQGVYCPTSAFTAIGAAFATQGLWIQADLLYYLNQSAFGLWAPLLYMCAAFAGFISLALGMPPKMYLWFFIGPGIYSWLIGTTEQVSGVAWKVAGVAQDQSEVWKLAELGLRNSNIAQRDKSLTPNGTEAPAGTVGVANFFINYDKVITGAIDWMITWTGVYRQLRKGGADQDAGGQCADRGKGGWDRWYLLSDLKWSMLENITGARLYSGELRDTFVSFLSSECGDALSKAIDKRAFIAAANSRSGRLPCTVFTANEDAASSSPVKDCSDIETGGDYKPLFSLLLKRSVPVPPSMRNLWRGAAFGSSGAKSKRKGNHDTSDGSFPNFIAEDSAAIECDTSAAACETPTDPVCMIDCLVSKADDVPCAQLLYYIIQGFRWEAGHIYYQLVSTAPKGMYPNDIVFNLFYGWDLRDKDGREFGNIESADYLKDLILIHLFKNEMAMARKIVDKRFSSDTEEVQANADTYLRSVGSKSKFAEVYSWALMVPYVQGILLYLMAMGYPFACVLIVVPGWHKSIFTWMSFWAWLRLWDLGFAIVKVLERSIWAMLGNSGMASRINEMVYPMQFWAAVDSLCPGDNNPDRMTCATDCAIPKVSDVGTAGEGFQDLLRVFDRALILGANMDLDLSNAYYIYIMSALYFAVPAVTGQLVLGAKAGATNMLQGVMGGVGGEAARGATSGFTSSLSKAAMANADTTRQEAWAKGMRQSGLAANAIGASNASAMADVKAGQFGATNSLLPAMRDANSANQNLYNTGTGYAAAMARQATSAGGIKGALAAKGVQLLGGGSATPSQNASTGNTAGDRRAPVQVGGRTMPSSAGGQIPGGGGKSVGGKVAGHGGQQGENPPPPEQGNGGAGDDVMSQMVMASLAAGHNSGLLDAFSANANYAGAQQYTGNQMAISAAQGEASVQHFRAQQASSAQRQYSDRLGSQARYQADMSAWGAKRDMGNQVAGHLGAMGMDTSFLAAGGKPTDSMGMAMSGMLGSTATSAAHFADPGGGLTAEMNDRGNWLQDNYGYDNRGRSAILGQYAPMSPGEASRAGWTQTANTLNRMGDVLQETKDKNGKPDGYQLKPGAVLNVGTMPQVGQGIVAPVPKK